MKLNGLLHFDFQLFFRKILKRWSWNQGLTWPSVYTIATILDLLWTIMVQCRSRRRDKEQPLEWRSLTFSIQNQRTFVKLRRVCKGLWMQTRRQNGKRKALPHLVAWNLTKNFFVSWYFWLTAANHAFLTWLRKV